jgi:hypothetical protein
MEFTEQEIRESFEACGDFCCGECHYNVYESKDYPLRCMHKLITDVNNLHKIYECKMEIERHKRRTDSYVIGLSPNNLLVIGCRWNYDIGSAIISNITHGIVHIDEATIIAGKQNAYDTLKEIQDCYSDIHVTAPTILEEIIDGNDIDPMQLHIYEVTVGKEVI